MPHVFHHNGLTCESEPGPQGAVCLMIYPTTSEPTPSEEPVNDEDHNHST